MKNTEYTIRQVIELTGVTEFSLRGWENRYKAFKPIRTQSGRRLYRSEDILKVKALMDLVARGHRISEIASFSLARLQKLVEDRPLLQTPTVQAPKEDFEPVIRLADQFKWDQLLDLISKKRKRLKPLNFLNHFMIPLIAEMVHQVGRGSLSIAQEHILSSIIKENLALVRSQAEKSRSKVRLVMASPEGDQHELGLLVASTLAAIQGVHVLYLGPHMPKRDFCEACIRYHATHALLVTTVSKKEGAKDDIFEFLHFLDRHLTKSTSILVAGRNTLEMQLSLRRDFKILKSFQEFEALLLELKS